MQDLLMTLMMELTKRLSIYTRLREAMGDGVLHGIDRKYNMHNEDREKETDIRKVK
jgi:hypothetical protein